MNRYLDALEIVAFDLRTSGPDLGNLNHCDLLIAAVHPQNQQLEQFFHKISDSIKLINPNVTYQTVLIDSNPENKLDIIMQKSKFNKLILFGAETLLPNLAEYYHFNTDNILHCSSLEDLHDDVNLKKQLWGELKTFLSQ